jgi:dolichol-phosphate mannosyltransferase
VKLSVVIPAHDEAQVIGPTLRTIVAGLARHAIDYEVLVVDDHSGDGTADAVARVAAEEERVRCIANPYPAGFGYAVRAGLDVYRGDAVALMMADGSDDPEDLVLYFRVLEAGYDCAFGSRFMPGATVTGYPRFKRWLNRTVNLGIRALFRHGYNDTTNAFKAYRREVIEQTGPFLSPHFNLTVELPLKAIVRGFSYAIVPTSWRNRSAGESKLAMKEMGSRYLFIVLYVFLEHHLSRGDYRHPNAPPRRRWSVATREQAATAQAPARGALSLTTTGHAVEPW